MKVFTAVVQLQVLLTAVLASKYSSYQRALSKCTVKDGNCSYHVILTGSHCSVHDPNMPMSDMPNVIDVVPNEMKKLDELETKLTRMMEGLSIRSLRHIRKIRQDLKEMATTMKILDKDNKKKLDLRRPTCPIDFISLGTWTSCYKFSNFNTTWHEAREYCSAFGANLVALDTVKEQYILDFLIKSNIEYDAVVGWWTSGNYVVRNRRWMWTSQLHLKPITFSKWAPGEPKARSTMHCMFLQKSTMYRWHDAQCTDRHNFICELEL